MLWYSWCKKTVCENEINRARGCFTLSLEVAWPSICDKTVWQKFSNCNNSYESWRWYQICKEYHTDKPHGFSDKEVSSYATLQIILCCTSFETSCYYSK